MKINLWLSLFLLTVALAACGSKTQVKEAGKPQTDKEQEALLRQLIDEGYIPFVGMQYELRITEQEAVAKGINAETYRKMLQMLEDGNKMIREHIEEFKNDPKTKELILNGDTIVFDKKTK